jgi:hypothetical protein
MMNSFAERPAEHTWDAFIFQACKYSPQPKFFDFSIIIQNGDSLADIRVGNKQRLDLDEAK